MAPWASSIVVWAWEIIAFTVKHVPAGCKANVRLAPGRAHVGSNPRPAWFASAPRALAARHHGVMSQAAPAFAPDVAAALQAPAGRVSVRYTPPRSLARPLAMDRMLMCTPYERVLAALVLDTKLNLRFVRTGSAAEGARVALVNVASLIDGGARHWDVTLTWDAEEIAVEVRDQHDDQRRPLRGAWRAAHDG